MHLCPSLQELHDLLSNSETSVSAFELIHCKVLHVLEKFLSNEDAAVPLTVRLKHFSSVFMGLPVSIVYTLLAILYIYMYSTAYMYMYTVHVMCIV